MQTVQSIITAAAAATCPVQRTQYGYSAYVPYHAHDPHGPNTEIRTVTRQHIMARISATRAEIALSMAADAFGFSGPDWTDDMKMLVFRIGYCGGRYDPNYIADWRAAVRQLIRQYRTAATIQ